MKSFILIAAATFVFFSCTRSNDEVEKEAIYITEEGDTLLLNNPNATVYSQEIDGETVYFEAVGEPEQTKKIIDGDTIWIFDFKERYNHY